MINDDNESQAVSNCSPAGPNEAHPAFGSPSALLRHVTKNWRQDSVALRIHLREPEDISPFLKRPFVLVLDVDAPILTRYERYIRHVSSLYISFISIELMSYHRLPGDSTNMDLAVFVLEHDGKIFGKGTAKSKTTSLALYVHHVDVINHFDTTEGFYHHLDSLDLLNPVSGLGGMLISWCA